MVLMANTDAHVLKYVTPNHFYVEVGREISAYFNECSGIGAKIDHKQYMEGGVNDQQRIYLGQAKFTEVTLKRGLTDNIHFWEWVSQAMQAEVKRENVSILTFNQAGETMQSWTLIGAVPVAWKAPVLKASDGNTVAIEQLTLAYEGLKILSKEGRGKVSIVERDESGYFPSN
jgi:phage tail-like protein